MIENSIQTRNLQDQHLAEIDICEMTAQMAAFGFRPAERSEIGQAIALGEELTGLKLVDEGILAELHDLTGATVWVTGQPIEGINILVPLTQEGVLSLRDGTFQPPAPKREHVAGRHEACYGIYCGIYAGRTQEARRAVMQSTATLRVSLFGTLPCFARAATEDGGRTMINLGFRPVSGGLPDLYCQEALIPNNEEAA